MIAYAETKRAHILRTPAEGADMVIWLAASPRARHPSGRFFFDREARRTHLLPFTREAAEERRTLWRLSEGLSAVDSRSQGGHAP